MKKTVLISILLLVAVLFALIAARPKQLKSRDNASPVAPPRPSVHASTLPPKKFVSQLSNLGTERTNERPKRKPSGELIKKSLSREMCETGLHAPGVPISAERLAEMRAEQARIDAKALAMAEWGAKVEADYLDSLTPEERKIETERGTIHAAREEIGKAIRSRAGQRLLNLAKANPELSRNNQLPDDAKTTDEKLLIAALERDRMEDPEAAAVIRQYLMNEKAKRLDELETGLTSDPEWAAANLQWLDEIAARIKIGIDPENEDWQGDFTGYFQDLNQRWKAEQPQLTEEEKEFLRNEPEEIRNLFYSIIPPDPEDEIPATQ